MISNIIAALETEREMAQRLHIEGDVEELGRFLRGFRVACKALGYHVTLNGLHQAYKRRGWQVSPMSPLEEMKKLGYSRAQIKNEIMDAEIDAWRQIAERLE